MSAVERGEKKRRLVQIGGSGESEVIHRHHVQETFVGNPLLFGMPKAILGSA